MEGVLAFMVTTAKNSLSCTVWKSSHESIINAFHSKLPRLTHASVTVRIAGPGQLGLGEPHCFLGCAFFICFLLTHVASDSGRILCSTALPINPDCCKSK